MESLKGCLHSKYFSNFGYAVAALINGPALLLLVSFTSQLRISERRTFGCDVPDCDKDCLKGYDEQFNSPPLFGFAILCFLPSPLVCIAYSLCCVKSQVDRIEDVVKRNPKNPRPRPRVLMKTRRVFCCYFLHLLVRFILRISFAVLQNSVFYASNTFYASVFPSKFACYVCGSTAILKPTSNITINCNNSVGSDNAFWAKVIWIVNICIAFLVFVEMCYVSVRALKSDMFICDLHFCQTYFFNKPRTPVTMLEYIGSWKSQVKIATEHLTPLIASGNENNNKALDDMYVNLEICTGRAEHRLHYPLMRQKYVHLPLKLATKVPIEEKREREEKLGELFLPNKDTEDPLRILIVGQPGTGKSLLCNRMLRDWCKDELSFADSKKTFEYFFLFPISKFKKKKYSLKKLLSDVCPNNEIDDDVFQDILDWPEKVLLVFDGLDEFKDHKSCLKDEQAQGGDGPTEEMPLSALYVKLVKGTQLKGATVVTTCRPNVVQSLANLNFDRRVEIMVFTPEKVQEYVHKFCAKNPKVMNRIWQHLSNNLELLSFCYIPLNTFIICSHLEKWIALEEQDSESTLLTKTTTEVYKTSLKLLILKCHPRFREETTTAEHLKDDVVFSDPVKRTLSQLGSLAKAGIEAEEPRLKSREVEGMENCGLLRCLPESEVSPCCFEQYYYFNHWIIQELLAARQIAKMLPISKLRDFIFLNAKYPKWQLVIQFVAGWLHGQENEVVNSFVSQLINALTAPLKKKENKQMALLMLKCLYEYNDETVVKKAASELHRNSKFDNEIDLSKCLVTSVECIAIAYFVRHLNVELTVLNLSDNSITDLGVSHLCERLKHCKLTHLDLSYNSITKQGSFSLRATFKHTLLNLRGNRKITAQGERQVNESYV